MDLNAYSGFVQYSGSESNIGIIDSVMPVCYQRGMEISEEVHQVPVFTDTSHSQSALWVPFKQAEVLAKADLAIGRSLALSQVDFPTRWWHVLR